MKKHIALIIDDNVFISTILADLLAENHPEIVISGLAHTGRDALKMIEKIKPDLIFLDVEMPDMTGFEVLGSLKEIPFQIIFITAHSHYAIQAIRFNALDYLLKPIKEDELASAINRFKRNKAIDGKQSNIQNALSNLQKEDPQDLVLQFRTQSGEITLTLGDIYCLNGARNYTFIHTKSGKTLSAKTLAHYESILEDKGFFRCHRSFLVNASLIQKIQENLIIMKDGSSLPLSRRKKMKLKSFLRGTQ
jgi:two-component system LytT family response regulator